MVLYDGNYRFLGMSEKLLHKLGYDDINEFSTYHKDFADLFEKDGGLIYNFENFSWIDFVLYGGANKDRAIIKKKDGQKVEIKVKIVEIPLKDEFGGVDKMYSVDIIEKGVVEDSDTQDNKTEINLSSMLSSDTKAETKSVEEKIEPTLIKKDEESKANSDDSLDINLSFIKEEELKDDDKSTIPSFSLDFLKKDKDSDEVIKKEPQEQIKEEATTEDKKSSDVVLNFFNTTVDEPEVDDEEKQEQDVKIKLPKEEPKEDESPSINLNFLKQDEPSKEEPKTEEKPSETPTINLNFLKVDDEEKQEQDVKIELPKDEPKEDKSPSINLNFLKQDEPSKEEPKAEEKPSETPSINLNFLKVDDEEKKEQEVNIELPKEEQKEDEASSINLNFLKQDEEKESPKQDEVKVSQEDKTKIIKQIKEDIEEIDNSKKDESKDESITINEALKNILNISTPIQEKKEEPKIQKEVETKSVDIKSSNFNFLGHLDISDAEKKEILDDFINDASYHVSLMNDFLEIKDAQSIKYAAIKIKSSAEILQLDQMLEALGSLSDITDFDKAKSDVQKLSQQIEALKNIL